MKTTLIIFLLLGLLFGSCSEPIREKVEQLTFAELEPLLNRENDTVYVVNFWATWCKPCVEELPAFEKVNMEYGSRAVKVLLVSLDFPSRYQDQLLPFIESHAIKTEVLHLTDVNANDWIDKVDPTWSGAIPATIIFKGSNRSFYEQKLSYQELVQIIENKL